MPSTQAENQAVSSALIRTFCDQYIRERDTGVHTTTRGRITDFEYFCDFLDTLRIFYLPDVTPAHVTAFNDWRTSEGDAPATSLRRFNNIKALLRYAEIRKAIQFNPAQFVKPPFVQKGDPRWLDDNEREQITPIEIPTEWRALRMTTLIELILSTGLRINAALNLKENQLDLLSLSIVDAVVKGKKVKTFPLPDSARPLIIAYMQARNIEIERVHPAFKYLGPHERGEFPLIISSYDCDPRDPDSFRYTDRAVRRIMAKRFGDIRPHRLRHTAVRDYYEATNDPFLTCEFATHERVETTLRYAGSKEEQQREAINKVRK